MLASYYDIGTGNRSIAQTIEMMRDNIVRESSDPVVIQTAHRIVRMAQPTKYDTARALFEWCRENTRYTKDPLSTEMLMSPKYMITQYLTGNSPITGDCDDFTQLGCALMRSVGLPVGMRVISVNGKRWHHIFGLVSVNGRVYPFDLTEPSFELGNEHTYLLSKDIWT